MANINQVNVNDTTYDISTAKKLTFTGAATASFDGSEAVTVEIPEASSSSGTTANKLTFTGAVTAEFDGSSAVTVDIPAASSNAETSSEWKVLGTKTLTESTAYGNISVDTTNMTEVFVVATMPANTDGASIGFLRLGLNSTAWFNVSDHQIASSINTPTDKLKNTYLQALLKKISGYWYLVDSRYAVNAVCGTYGGCLRNGDLNNITNIGFDSSGTGGWLPNSVITVYGR